MRVRWTFTLSITALLALPGCGAHPTDPLGRAAAVGDLQTVGTLLAHRASPASRDSALVWAARFGQPEAIAQLVKAGADPNGISGVNGWTVLMHAIHKNQAASVQALLKNGADVNARIRKGTTALIMAAGYGYSDIIQILLEHGADAKLTLDNGENALDVAAGGVADIDRFTWGRCQVDTVQLLRRRLPDLRPKDAAKLKNCM